MGIFFLPLWTSYLIQVPVAGILTPLVSPPFAISASSRYVPKMTMVLRIWAKSALSSIETNAPFDTLSLVRTWRVIIPGTRPLNPSPSRTSHILDLVDTRISHFVLTRIAHARNLQSLTLHGTFEEPNSASILFSSDHIIDGRHTFLPLLESFRFVVVGHDDEYALYQSVVRFLWKRTRLRRLDLGSCPWYLVLTILPELKNLRVLGALARNITQPGVSALVESLPKQMVAINLVTSVSTAPLV